LAVYRADLEQERQRRKARDHAFLERLAQPDPVVIGAQNGPTLGRWIGK
jgi:hypothetical protein